MKYFQKLTELPLKVFPVLGCICAVTFLVYVSFSTNDSFDVTERAHRSSQWIHKCWLLVFQFRCESDESSRKNWDIFIFLWRRCAIKAVNKNNDVRRDDGKFWVHTCFYGSTLIWLVVAQGEGLRDEYCFDRNDIFIYLFIYVLWDRRSIQQNFH